mmetsp:Transcript_23255/g.35207  ORF Transcript_23255/g.35207 Transcript_23255/m.35207 type:complete len:154 (+) Transcript_23255:135-596(+)
MSESFDQQVSEFDQEEDKELDQLERMSMSVSLDQEVTDGIQSPAEAEVTRKQQKQRKLTKKKPRSSGRCKIFFHVQILCDRVLVDGGSVQYSTVQYSTVQSPYYIHDEFHSVYPKILLGTCKFTSLPTRVGDVGPTCWYQQHSTYRGVGVKKR